MQQSGTGSFMIDGAQGTGDVAKMARRRFRGGSACGATVVEFAANQGFAGAAGGGTSAYGSSRAA